MIKEDKINKFLDDVSSQKPTPGGGSVAALVGAISASLVIMVANLTLNKERYEKVRSKVAKMKKEATNYKDDLLKLSDEDSNAFDGVMNAYKLDLKGKKREDKIQKALKDATLTPLKTAILSFEVEKLANEIKRIGNENAKSDALVAVHLAKASRKSALENVKINIPYIKDKSLRNEIVKKIEKTFA